MPGKPARRDFCARPRGGVVGARAGDGSHAIGLFNRTGQAVKAELNWSDAALPSAPKVRDLWLRKDLAKGEIFSTEITSHGCVLLRVE